jgi:hypothetical protein
MLQAALTANHAARTGTLVLLVNAKVARDRSIRSPDSRNQARPAHRIGCHHLLTVRQTDFHSVNASSTLAGGTKLWKCSDTKWKQRLASVSARWEATTASWFRMLAWIDRSAGSMWKNHLYFVRGAFEWYR